MHIYQKIIITFTFVMSVLVLAGFLDGKQTELETMKAISADLEDAKQQAQGEFNQKH